MLTSARALTGSLIRGRVGNKGFIPNANATSRITSAWNEDRCLAAESQTSWG
jgi:hypothetical protein